MKPLEDELRSALRRREPSPGFAERLVARIRKDRDARSPVSSAPVLRPARWAWFGPRLQLGFAAVAAAFLLVVSLSFWQRQRKEQQRREGEAARAQVMQALRITGAKLNRVRTKVKAATNDANPERLAD